MWHHQNREIRANITLKSIFYNLAAVYIALTFWNRAFKIFLVFTARGIKMAVVTELFRVLKVDVNIHKFTREN